MGILQKNNNLTNNYKDMPSCINIKLNIQILRI